MLEAIAILWIAAALFRWEALVKGRAAGEAWAKAAAVDDGNRAMRLALYASLTAGEESRRAVCSILFVIGAAMVPFAATHGWHR